MDSFELLRKTRWLRGFEALKGSVGSECDGQKREKKIAHIATGRREIGKKKEEEGVREKEEEMLMLLP